MTIRVDGTRRDIGIVQVVASGNDSKQIEGYLAGLVDLGWLDYVIVTSLDGHVMWLESGRDPEVFPGIEAALEGIQIDSVTAVTVAVPPEVPSRDGKSLWYRLQEILPIAPLKSILIVCPPHSDDGPTQLDLTYLDSLLQLQEQWEQRLIVSPEDRADPSTTAMPVRAASVTAHAAATAALLLGGLDGGISVDRLPGTPGSDVRIIRGFARLVDMDSVVDLLVSTVLDSEHALAYDQDKRVPFDLQPEVLVEEKVRELVMEYNLEYRPLRRVRRSLVVGLLPALAMLWAYIMSGLKRIPGQLVGQAKATAIARLESTVQRVVLGEAAGDSQLEIRFGGPSDPLPVESDSLLAGARELRSSLVDASTDGGESTIESFLPDAPEVEPSAHLWLDLSEATLGLLDGSASEKLVVEQRFAAPEPVPPGFVGHVIAEFADAEIPEAEQLRRMASSGLPINTDPWRMFNVIAALERLVDGSDQDSDSDDATASSNRHDGSEATSGREESDGLSVDAELAFERFVQLEEEASVSYLYSVGKRILGSVKRSRDEISSIFEAMREEQGNVWTSEPEKKLKRRLGWLGLFSLGGFILLILGGVFAILALPVLAIIVAVGLIGVVFGFVKAAVGYQRDAFAREQRWADADDLVDRLQHAWTALHRYVGLYDQYRHWAAILAMEVHSPVGRLGRLVVYGAQQTAPRWLVTARSVSIHPGTINRYRRRTFQRGWRVVAYRSVVDQLLSDYQETGGFDTVPDPAGDVLDRDGSRAHLVRSFVFDNHASVLKRDVLERGLRDKVVRKDDPLVGIGEVRQVQGRYYKVDSLEEFFDLREDDSDYFAGYLFAKEGVFSNVGNAERIPAGTIRVTPDRNDETVTPDSNDQTGTRFSERGWPKLVAVRLDYSVPVTPTGPQDIGPYESDPLRVL